MDLYTLPKVESTSDFSPIGCRVGPLHQLVSDEFARYILDGGGMDGFDVNNPDLWPQQVVINKLAFENVSLSRVLVTSKCPVFEPRVVMLDPKETDEMDEQDAIDCDESREEQQATIAESGCDDLLSMVMQTSSAEPTAKKRGRKPKEKSESSAQFRKRYLDKALNQQEDNPTLVAETELGIDQPVFQQLVNLLGDETLVHSFDEAAAKDLIAAFDLCSEQDNHLSADATFDLQPEDDAAISEEIFTDAGASSATASDSVGTSHQSVGSTAASSSSTPVSEPAAQSSGSCSTHESVLKTLGDGSVVKLLQFKEFRQSNCPYEVRRFYPNGISTLVGRLHLMSKSRNESYKAHCAIHRSCQCWVTNVDSRKIQRMIDWLGAGVEESPTRHAELSRELRQSCGIKVRS